ncbi:regucalcin-like isoform X2 [Chrysoperla carnea]|uniref:regucalcin-like isoform X2 n=1 Tax=Chrysoperla carnea TaxID=189513 RepID=UPI001D072F7C|nr:regucalcin-like isoform X2 [Chrysoperla carnea]
MSLINMCEPIVKEIGEQLTLGEGPHWDADQQALYYVDIDGKDNKGGAILKYVPTTGKITQCNFGSGNTVSLVLPIANTSEKFVVTINRKIVVVTWNGVDTKPSKIEEVLEVDGHRTSNRLNDGKCDPFGRVYAGTMGVDYGTGNYEDHAGSLYLIDFENKKANKLLGELGIANGLAWELDKKVMYYIDSLRRRVDKFAYDPETGTISNRQIAFDIEANGLPGFPDGMCIDTEGFLWVALFNGGRVIRVDPTNGKLVKTIKLPAEQITSCAFGGPNLDILYVTSAEIHGKGTTSKAGLTFSVTNTGARGYPGVSAVLP